MTPNGSSTDRVDAQPGGDGEDKHRNNRKSVMEIIADVKGLMLKHYLSKFIEYGGMKFIGGQVWKLTSFNGCNYWKPSFGYGMMFHSPYWDPEMCLSLIHI